MGTTNGGRRAKKRMAMAVAAITVSGLVLPATARSADIPDEAAIEMTRAKTLVVADGMDPAELKRVEAPVSAFYGFWVNGSSRLLDEALSQAFVDHTLPPGRPQGPTGPAIAYAAFSKAVPDLNVEVVQRVIAKDRVVSHLRFTGHFTGSFGDAKGAGQDVDFIATDILKITDGRITDNWHLEDNLTFLKQIGQIK
jgi:predicted ester cyclase